MDAKAQVQLEETRLAAEAKPRETHGTGAAIVSAENIAKQFQIYLNDRSRFFEFFGQRKRHEDHWALKDVSFEVGRGSSFGIIGANGAGKSTLLRLIAGISEPTRGTMTVRGSFSSLLDLGLGFHPTFTGRQNIHLNCSLLGMNSQEIEERIPQMIAFAEIEEFIDYPVRTYSSGMALRLGFAIAAHLDTELFLIDEVLAVGDQYFQRKCIRKIQDFVSAGKSIVLVSHDLHAIRNLCDTVMWLDQGEVRAIGPSREVVEKYMDLDRELARKGVVVPGPRVAPERKTEPHIASSSIRFRSTEKDTRIRGAVMEACAIPNVQALWQEAVDTETYEEYDGENAVVIGSGEVRVLRVQLLDGQGRSRQRYKSGEAMLVAVTFRTTEPVERPIMGVAIHRNDGVYVYGPNNRFDEVLDGTYDGIYTYFIHYPSLPLLAGSYRVSIAVFDKDHLKPHVWHNQLYDFEVAQDVEDHGLVRMKHAWGLLTHVEGEKAKVEEEDME
ncbi:MAG: ABC transporter ATP-binding protein [Myxococcota bacterium]|nr:ABC transporter ATP-binding protein [Myxococcota bacterium]